ncbi:hypothetical protein BCR37DRAFT_383300 [Protomyces lactucae-debilis]|uniref:Uncharacterized protein n=1 Tax=Protomyces lactucae-debilis TaxID=2754530 RepID=A0A1Y2EZG9_PROLT|nr:uncharacterized protein BCR37DRAFT_383300 [Protomyces lactucae-debilis]ORY76664.1 hypothetical protein BCR37DRAFT_383300 [Protomyces lactucae-debilis]
MHQSNYPSHSSQRAESLDARLARPPILTRILAARRAQTAHVGDLVAGFVERTERGVNMSRQEQAVLWWIQDTICSFTAILRLARKYQGQVRKRCMLTMQRRARRWNRMPH